MLESCSVKDSDALPFNLVEIWYIGIEAVVAADVVAVAVVVVVVVVVVDDGVETVVVAAAAAVVDGDPPDPPPDDDPQPTIVKNVAIKKIKNFIYISPFMCV